ncbi:hypothetical protein ACFCXP_04670 [Streptomyces niveus]|uniref:hypothetical protein n=1 Tax=Streptomyces niveus TaxID=193462 RepID=UPI0035DDC3E1
MRTITAAAVTGALLFALTSCFSGGDENGPAADLTAQGMVDELTELYPLPNGRDNTGSCDTGKDHPNDCRQLITTDPVSVYELKTDEAAEHWAKQMDGVADNTAVQAGRFALVWKAEYPSDQDAVDKMTARAQEVAAGK